MDSQPTIYIYPGAIEVSTTPVIFSTILGSCVSVCLWDTKLKIAGINHFMLPLWNGEGLESPRYGNVAIEKLINIMLRKGSNIEDIYAKVFGGGNIIESSSNLYRIGERNIEVAISKLDEYGISIINSSTGGIKGRKIMMESHSFKILHKFIEKQIT